MEYGVNAATGKYNVRRMMSGKFIDPIKIIITILIITNLSVFLVMYD